MVRRLGGHRRRISGHGRGGFTLAELLVVLGLVVVLIGLLLPGVTSARSAARDSKALMEARATATILAGFATETNDEIPFYQRKPDEPEDVPVSYAIMHWWTQVDAMQDSSGRLLPQHRGPWGQSKFAITATAFSADDEYDPAVEYLTHVHDLFATPRRFQEVRHPSEKVMLWEVYPLNTGRVHDGWCCIRYDVRGALARFDGSALVARVIDFQDHQTFDPILMRGVPAVHTWHGLAGRDLLINR